jgi:cell wall-associated NlpC family hydrolase
LNYRKFLGLLLIGLTAKVNAAPPAPAIDLSQVKASTDVTDISMKRRGDRWAIAISASNPVPFAAHVLPEGRRFYIDFPDCRLAIGKTILTMNEDGVTVRASQFSIEPAVVRVVVQSEDGTMATLESAAPSNRATITLPVIERPAGTTRIQLSTASEMSPVMRSAVPSLPDSPKPAPSRSTLSSRGGLARRLAPEELASPHDLMEIGDAAPVPSDGGSLQGVTDTALPGNLMEGVKAALTGTHRYVWGGETPDGFDCSGMAQFIYRYAGIQLPRTAAEQYLVGTSVDKGDLQPGDLVFFTNSKRIFHVALYIGNGRIFHAANSKRGLTTDPLNSTFYASHYAGGRRYFP